MPSDSQPVTEEMVAYSSLFFAPLAVGDHVIVCRLVYGVREPPFSLWKVARVRKNGWVTQFRPILGGKPVKRAEGLAVSRAMFRREEIPTVMSLLEEAEDFTRLATILLPYRDESFYTDQSKSNA